jgi:hypothetical protein
MWLEEELNISYLLDLTLIASPVKSEYSIKISSNKPYQFGWEDKLVFYFESLKEYEYIFDNTINDYYNILSLSYSHPLILLLNNEKLVKIKTTYGKTYSVNSAEIMEIMLCLSYKQKEYAINVAKLKIKQDSIDIEEQTVNNKIKEKNDSICSKKYGKQNCKLISEGKVSIGMTREMCRDSWGAPNDVNKTTNKYGTSEQWVYDSGSFLYFEGDILTTIQH